MVGSLDVAGGNVVHVGVKSALAAAAERQGSP